MAGIVCYLCGKQRKPADADTEWTRDHVPPKSFFPKPLPSNLITVDCCRGCNSSHGESDQALRIWAAMPFDRNQAGQSVLTGPVKRSLASGRTPSSFWESIVGLLPRIETPLHGSVAGFRLEAKPICSGITQITKGLLRHFYPRLDCVRQRFEVLLLEQHASANQPKLMSQLMQHGQHAVIGEKVFQIWHRVDTSSAMGAWLLVFYECSGAIVFHRQGSLSARNESTCDGPCAT